MTGNISEIGLPILPAATGLGLSLGIGLLLLLSSFTPRRKKTRPRFRRLRRLLDEAGHHRVSVATLLLAAMACALMAFIVIYAVSHAAPVAACFAAFASILPWAVLLWQVRRRRRLLAEVWPDVVDHLRSAVRSGLSLSEGLIELSRNGPDPLRAPFAEFGRDWRAGMSMDVALQRLKDRLADPVGDRIIMALNVTRELGGTELGRLLETLADVLRANARTRSELEARQSWTVNGAKLAIAAPWAVVLLFSTQPGAGEAYRNAMGMAVLAGGLVVSVICYRVMLRIGSLPQEGRVLA